MNWLNKLSLIAPFEITGKIDVPDTVSYESNLNHGQLTSQTPIYVANGLLALVLINKEIVSVLESGRYLLQWIVNKPLTSDDFKHMRVIFFSHKVFGSQRWGTASPITVQDGEGHVVPLRAHGNFAYQVKNPKTLWRHISSWEDPLSTQTMIDMLRPLILNRFSIELSEHVGKLSTILQNREALTKTLFDKIQADFNEQGLKLDKLLIQHISIAESDE